MSFSTLPPVDRIATALAGRGFPHWLIVEEARRLLDSYRARIRAGLLVDGTNAEAEVAASLECLRKPSLRRVINATGVVLHTNLGRAPLPSSFTPIAGYSNLEYDLETGKRGKRDTHLAPLLDRLTGGKASIVVNNNAAAAYLVLHEFGGEVLVSRGELIEIGDGFRIPDILAHSGATLREVGTTNRTHLHDYRLGITDRTRLILRVHPSNFHITGFTSKPELSELAALSRETGVPVYEDLGSGCVWDGLGEPLVRDSLAAGINLVSFSGDKLIGGSQAGIITGDAHLIQRLRRNPMYRALRVDKLVMQALEEALRALLFGDYHKLPAVALIQMPPESIRQRALAIADRFPDATVIEGLSLAGGGSTPDRTLPTWLLRLPTQRPEQMERRLRTECDPPIICRIADGALLFDLRTVDPADDPQLEKCLHGA
ncbi:L-seryl-tRNA(Sec) selenium transferase [Bryobacterales bacterium F-183]|nr:L-seryl-tRNA(Sec) selenium transferase [Bryobacterales bacterium F-183]